jgi:hypothetical protein
MSFQVLFLDDEVLPEVVVPSVDVSGTTNGPIPAIKSITTKGSSIPFVLALWLDVVVTDDAIVLFLLSLKQFLIYFTNR